MQTAFLVQDQPYLFGAQKAWLALVAGLAPHINVHVIMIAESRRNDGSVSPLAAALQQAEISFTRIWVSSPFSIRLIIKLRRMLRDLDVDTLHTIGPKATVHACCLFLNIHTVSSVHGWLFRKYEIKERLHEGIERWALKRFDRVVVLSSFYQHLLTATYGFDAHRIRLIPNGFPGPYTAGVAPAEFAAGMMGRFSEEKNHELFLKALCDVVEQHPKSRFLIAGEGPLRSFLSQRIREGKLEGHVELRGYMDPQDFFHSIDMYVLCSRIENLPYSLMEAMGAGVPAVATRAGGIPDLVEDGKNGLLVDPGDTAGLADALCQLMSDPVCRKTMGEAGRRT